MSLGMIVWVCVVLLVVLLGGCVCGVISMLGDVLNLEKWVVDVCVWLVLLLELLLVMQQFEMFEYFVQGMCDLFIDVWINLQGGLGLCLDLNCCKELLEVFLLDSLDMVGLIGCDGGFVVLVMVLDKVIYWVCLGVYLGQSDGWVIGVYEDWIELIEFVFDGVGGWLEWLVMFVFED